MSEPYILNIETSGPDCSVSLSKGTRLYAVKKTEDNWKHSRELTLLIDSLMAEHNLEYRQLSAVCVSKGPGSYTGLRVGLSVAKGLCYGLDIPLLSIDTLEIIATAFKEYLKDRSYIIASIDARRQEIYYQIFDRDFKALDEAHNLILEENSFSDYPNSLFCGDGAAKATEIIKSGDLYFKHSKPSAEFMVKPAYERFQAGQFENTAYFSPFYLKAPNITSSKKPLF